MSWYKVGYVEFGSESETGLDWAAEQPVGALPRTRTTLGGTNKRRDFQLLVGILPSDENQM